MKERLCKGRDCTAQNQMFLIDGAVEIVATMYMHEQINEAISRIRTLTNIKGIKNLCSKKHVIEILHKIKNQEFPSH